MKSITDRDDGADRGINSSENHEDVAPHRQPHPVHAPWVETVLAEGPDVMFEVVDLDPTDDCIEVVAAHFFGEKISVHSIR
jgi:hypothetical protein